MLKVEHEGQEIEVYTKEDLEAQASQRETAVKTEYETKIAALEAEKANLAKVSAEKTENFKKYNEMSVEEKAAYDANTTVLLRRGDALEEEIKTLKSTLTEKETKERDATKNGSLAHYHGGNDEVKKKMEDSYAALAGMPETTADEIKQRTDAAARLAGLSINSINPLFVPLDGEAPQHKEKKDFVETPAGQEAADLVRKNMGIPTPKQ